MCIPLFMTHSICLLACSAHCVSCKDTYVQWYRKAADAHNVCGATIWYMRNTSKCAYCMLWEFDWWLQYATSLDQSKLESSNYACIHVWWRYAIGRKGMSYIRTNLWWRYAIGRKCNLSPTICKNRLNVPNDIHPRCTIFRKVGPILSAMANVD